MPRIEFVKELNSGNDYFNKMITAVMAKIGLDIFSKLHFFLKFSSH